MWDGTGCDVCKEWNGLERIEKEQEGRGRGRGRGKIKIIIPYLIILIIAS